MRHGAWRAIIDSRFNPNQFQGWRVVDRTWHSDIFLAPDVSFAVAEAAILSLRRGTFVDARPRNEVSGHLEIDWTTAFAVRRAIDASVGPSPTGFLEIQIGQAHGRSGGGIALFVSVHDGQVVLHRQTEWIA
ncbi:MAG: hypothetical protein IT177_08685 [Acidobacteria bacterium]|nr:hypothetical protein [Acidobacteriota bacterium]